MSLAPASSTASCRCSRSPSSCGACRRSRRCRCSASTLSFPGYLIVLAIGYAALGTLIAHLIGKPLIPLQFMQQRYESDFRFAIARVQDHAEAVALMGGEKVERQRAASGAYAALVAQLGRAGAAAEQAERLHLRLLPRLDRVPDRWS